MKPSRCLTQNHEYVDGKKCFWCGEAKPIPNGKWPTGTWFQQRLAIVKARELAPQLRRVIHHGDTEDRSEIRKDDLAKARRREGN